MTGTKTKKRKKAPPKHLNSSETKGHQPNGNSSRAEAAVRAAVRRTDMAGDVYRPGHVKSESIPQTPGNTRIFYEKLLPLARRSHEMNQRRIHTGVVWLFVLPVLLFVIRNLTDSSKIAFLIIWIVGMFIIAAFLVMVAYQDNELQVNLDELQEYVPGIEDAQLGKLMLVSPESGKRVAESAEQLLRRVDALTAKKTDREETPDA